VLCCQDLPAERGQRGGRRDRRACRRGDRFRLPVPDYRPENKYKGTGVIDGNYSKTVSVSPTRYAPGELLAEIARGSTLQVRLFAGSRAVSSWTFDVHTLRLAPAALKGARWTCR
jgi:hypothetical protein